MKQASVESAGARSHLRFGGGVLVVAGIVLGMTTICRAHEPHGPGTHTHSHAQEPKQWFFYDPPDEVVPATMMPGSELYDADVLVTPDGTWLLGLEFTPGKGDQLWLGRPDGSDRLPVGSPGQYARPTLTQGAGGIWISYEAYDPATEQWDVFAFEVGKGHNPTKWHVTEGNGNDINHCAAAAPDGGIWVVWQAGGEDGFTIRARRLVPNKELGPIETVSAAGGSWHPSATVTSDGDLFVAWDRHVKRQRSPSASSAREESFTVLSCRRVKGKWQTTQSLGTSMRHEFEGRAHTAAGADGRVWVLWESGGENWGKTYRGIEKEWNGVTEKVGPLHRFRQLHLAAVDRDGTLSEVDVPQPTLALATKRDDHRAGTDRIGVFYERGRLVVDGAGRLWIVYRHYYNPQLSSVNAIEHHIESGWQIYARCLEGENWSRLMAFDAFQRDGHQRLEVTPTAEGITAVWSVGRTDRRKDPQARGIAFAELSVPPSAIPAPQPVLSQYMNQAVDDAPETPRRRPSATVGGREYNLYYGDLHRHTDLSLCFPFYDGSLDDAYRYGIEAAGLDFLGVTDHARDLDQGDVQSLIWWRSIKAVTRHRLGNHFVPFFAFERSTGNTDHNVISLRDDMLRSHRPRLPEFWKEIDRDTITIPHRTAATPGKPLCGKIWQWHDDDKRPLLEIYQGFRHLDVRADSHEGLDLGYHFGFIASSDHLSTHASYACVWSPEPGREPLFRSMQARRTFGATDRIELVFRAGDHWMGEEVETEAIPEMQVRVKGTAPLATIDLYQDGKRLERREIEPGKDEATFAFRVKTSLEKEHYFYAHLIQSDGNQAWSSPMWFRPRKP